MKSASTKNSVSISACLLVALTLTGCGASSFAANQDSSESKIVDGSERNCWEIRSLPDQETDEVEAGALPVPDFCGSADQTVLGARWLNTQVEANRLQVINYAQRRSADDTCNGLHRLLRYGEDWREGMRDDETGLPFSHVASCRRSDPLLEFVAEYNRLTKDEFKVLMEKQKAEDAKIGFIRPVAGTVSAIGAPESKVVTLDIGSNQGIAVEDHLAVRRDGSNDFCWLIVTSVKANESEAKFSLVDLVDGDEVIKDTTITVSHSLVTDRHPDPMLLAKRHAESDLELGIQRVLYCGKGAARGTVRLDEESGLRMQMNGGCIVSKELQSFTKEYNRLMREAAKTNAQAEIGCEG